MRYSRQGVRARWTRRRLSGDELCFLLSVCKSLDHVRSSVTVEVKKAGVQRGKPQGESGAQRRQREWRVSSKIVGTRLYLVSKTI